METEPFTSTLEANTETPKLAANENISRYGDKRAVAAMLRMSVRSVDNFLKAGMPHLKVSARCCRFDMEDVRRWLKEQYGQRRRGPAAVNGGKA